jgi:uncharacterized protein (TIGR02996 family)
MSDEAAILAAIAAQPAQDTPRLAYADWLDEHGDAAARTRAEFIRVQCEIKKIADLPSADIQQYANLYRRQGEILEDHRYALLGPLAELHSRDTVFDRGFLSEVSLTMGRFERHHHALGALRPLPRICVTEAQHLWWRLREMSNAALIHSLDINLAHEAVGSFSEAGAAHLAACPYFDRLTVLSLKSCELNGEALRIFADATNLPAIVELDISNNEILDDDVQLLVESPLWPRLKRLVLGGNPITDGGAVALANAATSRLENLNLRFTGIGLDGIRALSRVYGGRVDVF